VAPGAGAAGERLPIAKTLKLYLAGGLARSESGGTFPVHGFEVPDASRKDVRDAVRAGAAAGVSWAARDPYNRGQILYRVAEMLESRLGEFVELEAGLGVSPEQARLDVEGAVDLWAHYAGWTDKIGQVLGTVNDVPGGFVSFTAPQPMGLVGAVIGTDTAHGWLTSLTSVAAASLAAGNASVVVGGGLWSVPALTFAEVLSTSDIPAGVLQFLATTRPETARTLASASQVVGLDCSFAGPSAAELRVASADTFTRCFSGDEHTSSLSRIRWQVEHRTFWHPVSS
jgi:acyl-CoA reductase-like NAD-dependent aldehyde dehydrogenase